MSAPVNRDGISFEKLSEFLDRICFNNYLGIRLVRFHDEGVEIECPLRPQLMNGAGVLHGGVNRALLGRAITGGRSLLGRLEQRGLRRAGDARAEIAAVEAEARDESA